MADYEYAVMYPLIWGDDPHRTFDTDRDAAYTWVAEAIMDGFRTDVLYVARRPTGGWERDDIAVAV